VVRMDTQIISSRYRRRVAALCRSCFLALGSTLQADSGPSRNGIAMYWRRPAPSHLILVSCPMQTRTAPQGGRLVEGAPGALDSLKPVHPQKAPHLWQCCVFFGHEILIARKLG